MAALARDILCSAKQSPNSEMKALEIVMWKIVWKKIDHDFADLVKDVFNFESDRMTSYKSQPASKDSFKMAASEVNLSRRISAG